MAVKPDGKHLVSASRSLFLRVWDLEKGESIRTFKAHDAPIIVMDIDKTSTLVATGSADASIKIWDIDKGFCTHNLKGHGGVISSMANGMLPLVQMIVKYVFGIYKAELVLPFYRVTSVLFVVLTSLLMVNT
jgi:WD40 repeat protein